MKRMMLIAIGALPIVTSSFLPKPAAAETVLRQPLSSPAVVIADRRYDDDRRDNDRRDNDRRDDWRDRNSDRRDRNARYDDRQRYDSNGRYGSNGRYDNRRDNQHRVWIPGHWERGFLGIGRQWVAGHYETR